MESESFNLLSRNNFVSGPLKSTLIKALTFDLIKITLPQLLDNLNYDFSKPNFCLITEYEYVEPSSDSDRPPLWRGGGWRSAKGRSSARLFLGGHGVNRGAACSCCRASVTSRKHTARYKYPWNRARIPAGFPAHLFATCPMLCLLVAALCMAAWLSNAAAAASPRSVIVPRTHPLISYHGRWDADQGTWWCVLLATAFLDAEH